ncbi:putative bifunctional diguanylate cyclase/phosphodiesterase [Cohnella suwonensis]|uniref:Bifunctional diguanylate cyclase/phosphodiesterase n=1 Tax=Cohnella suwonensis TaxID=696072 RepID=A0ABW0LUQ4_9BACL
MISRSIEADWNGTFMQTETVVRSLMGKKRSSESVFCLLIHVRNLDRIADLLGDERATRIRNEIAKSLSCFGWAEKALCFRSNRFVVLHAGNRKSCTDLMERIGRMFRDTAFHGIFFQPVVGATELHSNDSPMDRLFMEMDVASRSAESGHQLFEFYSEEMYRNMRRLAELECDLFKAVENKEWEVYYQPKVSVDEHRIVGVEALIRWNRNGEAVSPDLFIPLAEKLGLIGHIGQAVMDKAFGFLRLSSMKDRVPIVLSVNLSPYQLMEPDFTQSVIRLTEKHGVNPRRIMFEITESAYMHHFDKAQNAIRQLKELGYTFSLDDFGVGYSSFQYLSRLDFTELKLDKSFVQSLAHNRKNRVIIRSIIGLAKQLGIAIVVEGVETKEQWKTLKTLNCHSYQGYYFSKPLSAEEWINLLAGKFILDTKTLIKI